MSKLSTKESLTMNKIYDSSVINWCNYIQDDIKSIMTTGELLDRHLMSTPKRVYSVITYPICCMPCIIWSSVIRIISCPIQCCCRGPEFMCSNNIFTNSSDWCLKETCNNINMKYEKPQFYWNINGFTKDDKLAIINLLKYIKNFFENENSPKVYKVIDYIYNSIILLKDLYNINDNIESEKNSINNIIDLIIEQISGKPVTIFE